MGGGGGCGGGGSSDGEFGCDGAGDGVDTVINGFVSSWTREQGDRGIVWSVALPVKGAGEDEVVVCGELAQTGLELALVD